MSFLEVAGNAQRIQNDFVWILAGGDPSTAFLKKLGVKLGDQDLTAQAKEAPRETKSELVSVG